MTWRIVSIGRNAKLDLKLGYLVIRYEDVVKIHLSEIAVLIIESTAVSITAALLCELSKYKIRVIFCDTSRNPYGELLPYYGSHDSVEKLRSQINWSDVNKSIVWSEVIKEKIRMQSMVLQGNGHHDASVQLHAYINEMKPGDTTNREGHAAKIYFNKLFGKDFSRKDDNPINSCLNYGYSIILAIVNREIAIAGYSTQLGIFHDNMFNHYNLGSDLMEPFRPLVDMFVVTRLPIKFDTDEKRDLISYITSDVKIDGKTSSFLNAVRVCVRSVIESTESGDSRQIKFCDYESKIHESNSVL